MPPPTERLAGPLVRKAQALRREVMLIPTVLFLTALIVGKLLGIPPFRF